MRQVTGSRTRRLRWTIVSVTTVLSMFATMATAVADTSDGDETASIVDTASLTDVRAAFGQLVREPEPRDDGVRHVDSARMVQRLQDLNMNTYMYPISRQATDLPDLLDEFLPAAEAAGIDVWVKLAPPSAPNCCSQPYGTDFVAWARELAQASIVHANLTAWTIDDLAYDLRTFTPGYVRTMQSTAKDINSSFEFVPVLYFHQVTSTFAEDYGPNVDGVVLPFRDEGGPQRNTSWSWNAKYQIGVVSDHLAPYGASVFLMPYVYPYSKALQPPTVDYVEHVTSLGFDQMAAGEADGVVQYLLPLVPGQQSWTRPASDNLARTGDGRLSFVVPDHTETSAGSWCGASQNVRVQEDAASYSVAFWHHDGRGPGATSGYHFKQLLVDGVVVWERDVTADAANTWQGVSIDLTSRLEGKSTATLQWRLHDKKGVANYLVDVGIDDITTTGLTLADGDVEVASTWTAGLQRSDRSMYCSAQVYEAEFGAVVGNRVAALYGSR